MTRLGLTCIFLCVLFSTNSQAQYFIEGDSLVKAKQYTLAQLAYERAFFEASFDTTINVQTLKNQAILKKIYTQKKMGHFVEASQSSQRFLLDNLKDSAQFILRYEAVVCSFLAKQFDESLSQIEQTRYFIKDSLLTQQLDFWEIMTLAELGNYEASKQKYKAYTLSQQLNIDLEALYDFAKKPRFKDTKKAQTLATFLPGAGLIYVGKTGKGLASLLLQTSALGFGAWSFVNGYYVSGFLTGLALFQAFYFGGIKLTDQLAQAKNQALRKQYAQRIRTSLLSAKPSL